MMAVPRLRAGLMLVPVMGMVAKCTRNTANPMGRGASLCNNNNNNNNIIIIIIIGPVINAQLIIQ
jgi:hypothetical protein